MYTLLLGLVIGLVIVIPPGPLGMAVVGLGTQRGGRVGVRAGLGVAGADVVLGTIAVVVVAAGMSLPESTLMVMRFVSVVLLMGFGGLLLTRSSVFFDLADRIDRPAWSLFALTLLSPLSIVAWIALLAAMPFAAELFALARFAAGVTVASFMWHSILGAGAGWMGERLGSKGARMASRFGGICLIGVALIALRSM